MANRTPRFSFTTFDSDQDTLAQQNYKAFGADRVLLDRLLTYAVEKHRHDGSTLPSGQPEAPKVTLSAFGGGLPPSRAVYYCTSLVDLKGQEARASRVTAAYTPPQVPPPGAPTLTADSSHGSLLPGDYLYLLSAYTETSDRETEAGPAAAISLAVGGTVGLQLPSVPSGATGWNIYRKGPTDYEPTHIGTETTDVTVYEDDGLTVRAALRPTPTRNTSSTSSKAEIDLPALLPAGYTCKIYRTYDPSDWSDSLLTWTALLPFADVGHATRPGSPPAVSMGVGGAPKIELGANTTGAPPPRLATPPTSATFTFDGPVAAGIGAWQWVNEYDFAVVQSVRAALGRHGTPAEQPVIVALERRSAGTGPWLRFQTDSLADITIEIPVGERTGFTGVPYISLPDPTMYPGDALRVVILQSGGGDEPTDTDLAVVVTLTVQHGSSTQTYNWET